ncbi:ATP-dependent helicase HrpB [Pseudoblastomonas halimionae]|uniref:RNA helicase n=1 Tax=Alteriqipengyuania halimionae TaxID=1926630 RepID=A0A6I4TZS4_9SPHN|nr:ATP-dependent helicase HrpB [Alteriqipengyuania halimionae]MXP09138.1 ATP-dependent helicase HrpB [Alteriqipengyuania halimionae]
MSDDLPIHDVLPDLLAHLRARNAAVLVAPPGAGKTTSVAPALLGEEWCDGTVILLSPRRVAARAAAERMAELLGEKPGETIGYLTRLDTRRSAKTRVLVMTEAIFVATILDDPELSGVSAVLFDEAHERHLDSDFGLALAIESQQALRGDLRLLVMSATIDGARFAALLDDAPVVESEGRAHPLRIAWHGARPELRIEDAMTEAVLAAWRAEEGSVLAFLPGLGEIERTRERIEKRLPDVQVLPLHGQVNPAGQRAAIRRDPEGRRRIVLASAIAESSVTLDGVSVVVDAGLSRRAAFDPAAGTTRLVTVQASRASADQRAGRAARQGPGVAYRLWNEAAHAGRPAYDPPEVETADLAPLALSMADWGAADGQLAWLDPPPAAAMASARERLQGLDALDGGGRITARGKALAKLPMDPQHGAMLLFGAEHGAAELAAKLVALLQDRTLGGRGEDLEQRLSRWNAQRGGKGEAHRRLAQGWAKRVKSPLPAGEGLGVGGKPLQSQNTPTQPPPQAGGVPLGITLAAGLPQNIARRRDASGEYWLSAGGRGYRLDPASPVARSEWIAIGDAQGNAKEARIMAAAALTLDDIEQWLPERFTRRTRLDWHEAKVRARLERKLGSITLASAPDSAPDQDAMAELLLQRARETMADLVPATLLARARYAGIEALRPESLAETADQWLAPLLEKRRDLAIAPGRLVEAALNLVEWDDRQWLDRIAPREFRSPAGTSHAIDYADPAGPSVEVRVQALFGLDRHPVIGQGEAATPLLLKLTSPAGRPLQSTADLPGFWRGSWSDVRKDMKGRYPKHRWPEEPWTEKPSLKTRNAFAKSEG